MAYCKFQNAGYHILLTLNIYIGVWYRSPQKSHHNNLCFNENENNAVIEMCLAIKISFAILEGMII